MRNILKNRKNIAIGLLAFWLSNTILPSACYALTSGPAQPEARSFQPAGVSDMVDLFTGDFKYNIPLLDVDGYPINLNYESGSGMDDEASWVGLGWNVNVGAINRQVRGIPDDMAGDQVEVDEYTKPKVTVGGTLSAKIETVGEGKALKATGSFSLGVFNDNYTGIGAEISANAGISFAVPNETSATAGLGLGITSNTASGVELTPNMNLSISANTTKKITESAGLSASLGYNTRSGLKSLTLGSSFDVSENTFRSYYNLKTGDFVQGPKTGSESLTGGGASGSAISYNTEPINPNISIPYRTSYGSFSIDVGTSAEVVFGGLGATGYKSVREVVSQQIINPAYGFLYAERGKDQKNAVMDFTREKENPIIPELPNLAIPVHTPDLFSYTSQTGSGQFRLYRGGSGAFFDNAVSDDDGVTSLGGDIGYGFIAHGGVTLYKQHTQNNTRKWTSNNNYLPKADFQDVSYTLPSRQHAYFKMVGEKTLEDSAMVSKLHDTQLLQVSIGSTTANASFANGYSLTNLIKTSRQVNQTEVSYLTAAEASDAALDRKIYVYPLYDSATFALPVHNKPVAVDSINRVSAYRQGHHFSEITVTDGQGKRMVYGLPVYNTAQSEYSFAIGSSYSLSPQTNNAVRLSVNNPGTSSASINHNKGIDYYYHRQTVPAYASSFLLTAILSPDYVDRTGNGITDDDLGTAIKFNYAKLTNTFKWRSPFKGGTLNKCLLADKDDDKASIVYGEKEIWYLSSIESKTKVAYFIMQDRRDAAGVTDFTGLTRDTSTKQRCLKEIRLYSKADMTKPIKVVKFEYSYELCRHLPNNLDNTSTIVGDSLHYNSNAALGGKLTLKKVYFEYQNSPKGANFPYVFSYIDSIKAAHSGPVTPVNYSDLSTDRWGVYKSVNDNIQPLKNDQFPYTLQDIQGTNDTIKSRVDQCAALWHLNTIKLPTGGVIHVNYESDDYAYVQDKRAAVMSGIQSLIAPDGSDIDSNHLQSAAGFRIQIPNSSVTGDPTTWFKQNYLNGSDYIYSKFSVKVSTPYSPSGGFDDDFVSTYSLVDSVSITGGSARVFLQYRNDGKVSANPIAFSSWQTIKNEYPRYAYPGFDQRTSDSETSSAISTAVSAVLASISNLSELTENFYEKANKKGFGATIHPGKCFVRIVKQDGHKLGGGVRVKQIQITDSWQGMSGDRSRTASYGQAYSYTTVDNGQTISSGVASYEPSVGCDENPLRQPVPYVENIKAALDNFFELEQPFGESFFPAPSVGYSKVTVTDLNKNGVPDPGLRTGYTVSEFYTARDFPVQVSATQIQPINNMPNNKYSFIGATAVSEMTMSQGYSIILNDMHGKQKATRTFNQSGAEIASSVYYYKADQKGADEFTLNNAVDIVNPNGTISHNKVLGRDIDFFTDFREFETKNSGFSDNLGFDVVDLVFFAFPLPHFPQPANDEYKLFRSACAVKVSQYYGIIDHVVKTENGSTITTQNVAFDGLTGQPVVTQTQNEFNNTIYSVTVPAYWVYPGMSGAYQNSDLLLQGFNTDANATVPSQYAAYLKSGDELVDLSGPNLRYWVLEDKADSASVVTKKLVNRAGTYQPGFHPAGLVKLVRSGYRNMLGDNTQSIVCLNNPIQNNKLQLASNTDLTNLQVINASATTFNESWPMDQHGQLADSTAYVAGITHRYEYADTSHLRGAGGGLFMPGGDTTSSSLFWKQALNRSGIWLKPYTRTRWDTTVMVDSTITLGEPAQYVGYSGDGNCVFKINGFTLSTRSNSVWCFNPVNYPAGTHVHIQIESTNNSPFKGGVGMEFYDNDTTQLKHASSGGSGIQTVFTTYSMAYHNDTIKWAWRKHINPYVRGFLGNWRERGSVVFQQSRHYNPNTSVKGVAVKNAGYINNFKSYWYYSSGAPGWITDTVGNRVRWVTANTVTGYDEFGQQIENKDALGRFSAAKFDFNGELPSAVASNAQNREIYAAAFEDLYFSPGSIAGYVPDAGFVPTSGVTIKSCLVDSTSHSGNYSVKMPSGGLTLKTVIHNQVLRTDSLLSINTKGEYNLKSDTGLYPTGFAPMHSKKYIFDVWVRDGVDTDMISRVGLKMNGNTVTLNCKALVEGWKLIEGTMDISTLGRADTLSLALSPLASGIFVDDIRMHPFNSQMKTYVYDDKTMRLMAEIDENGFATFYEYDDEGLLIRVKKETERGIMTIKESRSSYKKGL
jgi:hypothetical protein